MNRNRWPGLVLMIFCLPIIYPPLPQSADGPKEFSEYVLKAGFLYNFAKYVQWPAQAFASEETPVAIGVLGIDPFKADLDKTFQDKVIGGRKFVIYRFATLKNLRPVHILFVAKSEKRHFSEILKKVNNSGVLTVGEDVNFTRAGGVISILIEERRPKLEINLEAAKDQNLLIDSKLLKIATIVKREK